MARGQYEARHPRPWLLLLVGLLVTANTLNIAADIAAMAERPCACWWAARPIACMRSPSGWLGLRGDAGLRPTRAGVRWLKWLTPGPAGHLGVVCMVHIDWGEVLLHALPPQLRWDADLLLLTLVAVLGTTISSLPLLLAGRPGGWKTARPAPASRTHPRGAPPPAPHPFRHHRGHELLQRHRLLHIINSTAATLHRAGITHIETSAQAVGRCALWLATVAALLRAGIIGTGPAGCACAGRLGGQPRASLAGAREGRGFYGVIAVATLVGVALCFSPMDPGARAVLVPPCSPAWLPCPSWPP